MATASVSLSTFWPLGKVCLLSPLQTVVESFVRKGKEAEGVSQLRMAAAFFSSKLVSIVSCLFTFLLCSIAAIQLWQEQV